MTQGWKPECGFLNYGWEGYSEALLLYVLGLGSPTHPLTAESYPAWTVTYQWENLYGHDFLYAGPLFIHQFSHAWIDFRGIRDRVHAREGLRLFREQPARDLRPARVRDAQSARLRRLRPRLLGHLGRRRPERRAALVAGRRQAFFDYVARGVPYGPDDGTIAGSAVLASLPFAPEIALPALRSVCATRYPQIARRAVLRERLQPDARRATGRTAGSRKGRSASTRG